MATEPGPERGLRMDRVASRREKLRRTLRPDGVEALLIASPSNVTYLTGFGGDSSALILTTGRAILVSDGRYATQIERECPGVEVRVRPVNQTILAAIGEAIGLLELGRVGFEAGALTVAAFEDLKQASPGVAFLGLKGRVEALRAIKDAGEVAAIREAVSIAERAFTMFRAGLRGSDTEKDAADDLETFLRRCGATAASFASIVAVGPNAALPHHRPDASTRIDSGDFVLIDWGASGRPYKSDLTRMLLTGKVTAKLEKVYRSVLDAQARAIAAIRPGTPTRDVDAEARSSLMEAGFGRFFSHGLGHGVGIDIHEAPALRADATDTLRPGMIVTVEPGVYLPGWGGVRIEDDVLVTPDGCEVLTHLPKSFDTIRL